MLLSGLIKDVEAASAVGNAIAFPMMFVSIRSLLADRIHASIHAVNCQNTSLDVFLRGTKVLHDLQVHRRHTIQHSSCVSTCGSIHNNRLNSDKMEGKVTSAYLKRVVGVTKKDDVYWFGELSDGLLAKK